MLHNVWVLFERPPPLVIIDRLQIINYDTNPIQFQGGTKVFYIYTLKKLNKNFCIYFVLKKILVGIGYI